MNPLPKQVRLIGIIPVVLEGNGHFGYTGIKSNESFCVIAEMKNYHLWPSRMKDFKPLPLPVKFALPPRATVMAVRTALLPPANGDQQTSN
jgi:hypothetical protein